MYKKTLVFGIILLLFACSQKEKAEIFWINSYQVDCVGVGPMKCMLIQKGEKLEEGAWQNFYSKIEGFEYEPGYIFKLKVKEEQLENVPADASTVKYTLIKMLEKREDGRLKLNGTWYAFKIKDTIIKSSSPLRMEDTPNLNFDIAKMQISGNDNCNNFMGSITKVDEKNIEWGPLATTQKMCPDMTTADDFNQALQEVKQYIVEDNTLILMDEDGKELLEFYKGVEARILLNDIWVAEIVENEIVTDTMNAPRLEFNSLNLEVSGTDGCNNLNGKLTVLTNSELVFSLMAGTRMVCADMTIPDKFNDAIPQIRGYKIDNRTLTLHDIQGKVLILMKKTD